MSTSASPSSSSTGLTETPVTDQGRQHRQEEIIRRLRTKTAHIGIVGLGYVGLPLALAYTQAGYPVTGFDIDPDKVSKLVSGNTYIEHISEASIAHAISTEQLKPTVDFSQANAVDVLILCVPTPLSKHFEPDLSYVNSTIEALLPHLRAGQVLSLESTTYPGTTEEELKPRIESRELCIGEDFFLVYSPEREDPGNQDFTSDNTPKLVGGSTPDCLAVGQALYQPVCGEVVPVSSTKVAEFAKLLENIYRSVNIGLVNELKVAADRMGIDIWEVINAAATKPYGFQAFYPGPGVGGHCIPIDPFYLTWKAREFGVHTRFIELAGEINRSMPHYVASKAMEALNRRSKAVKGSNILVIGLAYKPDVDDMRESPAFEVMDRLVELGAIVDYHDPHVPSIRPTREHSNWTGKNSVPWDRSTISSYDLCVITTAHRNLNLLELADWADLIVDTRNAMNEVPTKPDQVIAA